MVAEMAGFRGDGKGGAYYVSKRDGKGEGKGSGTRRACKYGANCYQKNKDHRALFSHPGDADWFGAAGPHCHPVRGDAKLARALQDEEDMLNHMERPWDWDQRGKSVGRQSTLRPDLSLSGGYQPRGHDALAVLSYTEEKEDGSAGRPVHVDVVIRDARPALAAGRLSLSQHGFNLAPWPTRLSTTDFYTPANVERRYYPEMEELIKRETGASTVVILNNIVRNAGQADQRGKANPFAGGGNGVNGYANVVHTDFRAKRSAQRYHEQPVGVREANGAANGKYIMINAWRNISGTAPIFNNTLACCDQTSVSSPEDYLSVDVPLTAEATAEQYRLKSHTAHRHKWYYFPSMMKDEVLLFIQYDSDVNNPTRFCFHTAFDDPTVDPKLPQRESVEVRAIAFFQPPLQPSADPVQKQRLEEYVKNVHPPNVGDLLKALAQGASNKLLSPADLEELVEKAAYESIPNEEFIQQVCAKKGLEYRPYQWRPGKEADAMMEEMSALKTFERQKFLQHGGHQDAQRPIDGRAAKADLEQLRAMFPGLDPKSAEAVYKGFGGNFETAVEMLSLALAEEKHHVH